MRIIHGIYCMLHEHVIQHIIWVRSWNCGCLVTWFCYQLIAKPGNKTAAVSCPDPFTVRSSIILNITISQSAWVCRMCFYLWCWTHLWCSHLSCTSLWTYPWVVVIGICGHFLVHKFANSLAPGRCGSNFEKVIINHMLCIKYMSTSCEITPVIMSQNTFDRVVKFPWIFLGAP